MRIFENIVQGFVEILGYISLELAFYAIAFLYAVVCFGVFDAFHITNPNTQICIGVAPFLALAVGAIWAARRGKIKVHRDKVKGK